MRRLGLLAGVAAALVTPAPAAATDFSVTTLADLDGALCGTPCSLRQAVNDANTTVSIDGTGDVIHLPAGTLARNPAFAAVRVTAPVVLVGTGARTTTIAGSSNPGFSSRALTVTSSSPIAVELRDLSVAGGLVEATAALPAQGGGIHVTGAHLTLRRVTVRDNQALDSRGATTAGSVLGGGIFTDGALTLDQVTLRDNRAIGTWASTNNTISAAGGAAYIRGASTSIRNSTVVGNAADGGPGLGYAGGLQLGAGTQLEGVTVTGNRVGGTKGASGGNIASSSVAQPSVSGSIIADGRGAPTSANCIRTLASGGGNVEDAGQCGLTSASDKAMTDPKLGPLQDNGGSTDTRAPLAGSAAIDLAEVCAVDLDQRGTTRPQGPACDAGAVEQAVAPPGIPGSMAPPVIGSELPTSGLAPLLGAPASPAPRRCTLGLAGDARRLRARIACDRAGRVRLTGRMTIRPGRARTRSVTRQVRLPGRTIPVTANVAVVVRVAVPRAASRAVRRRDRVSVTLTATQLGDAGVVGRQTARIARLRSGASLGGRPAAARSAGRSMTATLRAWAPIASGGMNTSDQVGLARTSDGVLHIVWRRRALGQELLHVPVAPSGRGGAAVVVAGNWAAIGTPALVARGRSLSAFFPGVATQTTGDPTYGLNLATSPDAGASWSLNPAAIATNEFAFARTPAAILTTAGTSLQAWSGTEGTVVHAGLNPGVPAVGGYGAGSNQALAATDDGQAMVAWCDQQGAGGDVKLARVDPATGARLGGLLSLPDSGRCGADTRVALAAAGATPGPPRSLPAFRAAVSSADGRAVRLSVIAGGATVATSTLAAGSSFKQQIAIATEDRGTASVWVCWRDSDADALACRRDSDPSRSSPTFGAKVLIPLPRGQTLTQLALDAQDDRVDAVATMSDDENLVGLFTTQAFPGLTLEGGTAAKLTQRGFRVTDDGRPIGRASVRVAGRTLTTGADGYAKVRLQPGSYTARASKPRYVDASVRVRIR